MPTMDVMIGTYKTFLDGTLCSRIIGLSHYDDKTGKIIEIDHSQGYDHTKKCYQKIDRTNDRYMTLIPLIAENYTFEQKDFTAYINTITTHKTSSIYADFKRYKSILIKTMDIMFQFCPSQVQFTKLMNIVLDKNVYRNAGQLHWVDVLGKNGHTKIIKKNIDKLVKAGYKNIGKYIDNITVGMYIDMIYNLKLQLSSRSYGSDNDPDDKHDEMNYVLSHDKINKLLKNEKDNNKIKNIYLTLLDGYGDKSAHSIQNDFTFDVHAYTNLLQYYIETFDPNYKLKLCTFNTLINLPVMITHNIFTGDKVADDPETYMARGISYKVKTTKKGVKKGENRRKGKIAKKIITTSDTKPGIIRQNISKLFEYCNIDDDFRENLKNIVTCEYSRLHLILICVHAADLMLDIIGKDNYGMGIKRALFNNYLLSSNHIGLKNVDWSPIEKLIKNGYMQLSMGLINDSTIVTLRDNNYDIKAVFEYLDSHGVELTNGLITYVVKHLREKKKYYYYEDSEDSEDSEEEDSGDSEDDEHVIIILNDLREILEYLLGFKLIPSKKCMVEALTHNLDNKIIKMLALSGGIIDEEVIHAYLKMSDTDSYMDKDFTEYGIVYDEQLYDVYHRYRRYSKNFDYLKKEGNVYTLYSMIRDEMDDNSNNHEAIMDYISTHQIEYDTKMLELAIQYRWYDLAKEFMKIVNPTPLCLLFSENDTMQFKSMLYDKYMATIG
jgi:hypothetical protein